MKIRFGRSVNRNVMDGTGREVQERVIKDAARNRGLSNWLAGFTY